VEKSKWVAGLNAVRILVEPETQSTKILAPLGLGL
jgi:hypothetical protein